MKRKQFEKFAHQHILPNLKGYECVGDLIYQVPVGNILRGFVFESSGFNGETFHPDVFVQPLYVRSHDLTITLGERLPGLWKFTSPADAELGRRLLDSISTRGLAFLNGLGTPAGIANNATTVKSPKNHYVRQAAAYSLILTGEYEKCVLRLDDLLVMLAEMSMVQKWVASVHDEVQELRSALLCDPNEAQGLLSKWTEETRIRLRLPQ